MGLIIIFVNFYYMLYLKLNLLENYKSADPFCFLSHKKEPTKVNVG